MLNYSLPNVTQYRSISLRNNFGWTFSGNVVYAASQWGILMILSKIGTPEMVGRFALGLAVTAPIIILANLNLRIIQATDAGNEFHFFDYLTLRMATAIIALLTIAITLIVSGYAYETAAIIFTIGLAKAVESISDVYYGQLQLNEQMKYIAISMTIRGTLSLLVFGVMVSTTDSVFWGVIALENCCRTISSCYY